jgi:hypothetical protein
MQDTPEHIKQIQLDIWMSKTMSERLERTILDNDALFKLWQEMRKQISTNDAADLFNSNLHQKK